MDWNEENRQLNEFFSETDEIWWMKVLPQIFFFAASLRQWQDPVATHGWNGIPAAWAYLLNSKRRCNRLDLSSFAVGGCRCRERSHWTIGFLHTHMFWFFLDMMHPHCYIDVSFISMPTRQEYARFVWNMYVKGPMQYSRLFSTFLLFSALWMTLFPRFFQAVDAARSQAERSFTQGTDGGQITTCHVFWVPKTSCNKLMPWWYMAINNKLRCSGLFEATS